MAEVLRGNGRMIGSLALGVLVLGACNEPDTQVGKSNYVDCVEGPMTGRYESNLIKGSVVDLDLSEGGSINSPYPHLKLISDGDGGMQIDTEYAKPLPVIEDGVLRHQDRSGILYEITSSIGNKGTTHLIVDLSCPIPQISS